MVDAHQLAAQSYFHFLLRRTENRRHRVERLRALHVMVRMDLGGAPGHGQPLPPIQARVSTLARPGKCRFLPSRGHLHILKSYGPSNITSADANPAKIGLQA